MSDRYAAERAFDETATEFVKTDVTDGGRTLRAPGRVGGGMKIHLDPMQSRHEVMLRMMVTQVASLTTRVRELEAQLGTGVAGEEAAASSEGETSPSSAEATVGSAQPGDPAGVAKRAKRSGAAVAAVGHVLGAAGADAGATGA